MSRPIPRSLIYPKREPELQKLLLVKPKESYSYAVQDEVNLLTFDKHHPSENFGSFVFRMQPFAGDVDLTEEVRYPTERATISTFIRKLKSILRDLDKDHIFSEFKGGFDHNYLFPVGALNNGIYTPNEDIEENLSLRYEHGLFTDEEYDTMMKALEYVSKTKDTTIHEMAYDYVYDTIRNRFLLRWNKDELLDGYKILSDGSKYLLAKALRDETIVKIDLISLVNHKYVEVTNIVSLQYDPNEELEEIDIEHLFDYPKAINISERMIRPKVQRVSINIDRNKIAPQPLGLQQDIEKLYYSNKFYSPFKACKRVYSVMRQLKNYAGLIKQLAPIIRGEISLLYQIKSELEAINIALKISPTKYHMEHANSQLQDIKGRLNYVLDITNDRIKNFSEEIDHITDDNVISEKIELIDHLSKDIKKIIQFLTIEKMNQNNFNPFNPKFLPPYKSYDRSKVRKPTDDPTQVFKDFVNSLKY